MKKMVLCIALCLTLTVMPLIALAGVATDHDCYYPDGQIWCVLCDKVMEHECISNDGNARCDLCDELIAHTCYDYDRNQRCDLCTRPCNTEDHRSGDITGDGKVNMADVAKLYAHITGKKILTAENGFDRCDITGEGNVNMADVAKLYAHIRGTQPSTETEQVRRISRVDKLGESFALTYKDETFPQVTFLLRGNPYLISTFYPNGQVKTEEKYTASNEVYHVLEYNEQGQLMSEHFPEPHSSNFTLEYTYTPEGLPETVTASAPGHASQVVKKWVYDDQGRTLDHEDTLDQWLHGIDPYGYDPYSSREIYEYDEKGQVINYHRYRNGTLFVHQSLTYDDRGNVTVDAQKYFTIGLERQIISDYTDQGLLLKVTKQEIRGGITATYLSEYRYDNQQQKIGCTHTWSTGEVFEESWTYDAQGVLREAVTYDFYSVIQKFIYRYNAQGLMTERTILYYDEDGQVYHTTLALRDYDSLGNLVKKEYYENDNWVETETYEYEQNRLVYLSWKDRYNPPGFQRRHYDDAGNLIDVSTNTLESLSTGTDTLIAEEFTDRTVFYAFTYEEATVTHSDATAWEKIEQYIMDQMKKRDQ